MGYVMIALLAALVGGGAYVYMTVKNGLREISKMEFGTEDIMEGLKMQEEQQANTPKAAMGMTRLILPRLERDFPEFHWPEWKAKCENLLTIYLKSLAQNTVLPMEGATDALKEDIRLEIEDRMGREVKEQFDDIRIHDTELTDYKKESGLVKLRMQTSLEYHHSLDGTVKIENRREQHRYYMELYYVQDITQVGDFANGIGLTCKSCGAPITNLGAKFCEYCGTALEPINIRVWALGKIEKRD